MTINDTHAALPDWAGAPAVLAVCNDTMDRRVFVRDGEDWWKANLYAANTASLRQVTPLYPKEVTGAAAPAPVPDEGTITAATVCCGPLDEDVAFWHARWHEAADQRDAAQAWAHRWKETTRHLAKQVAEFRDFQKATQANFDYVVRQRDEARATAGELRAEQGAAEQERDAVADGLAVWESMTARELLEKAWEAAHVPADGTIPAGAWYVESHTGGAQVHGPWEAPNALAARIGSTERRLVDPPTPARPEGAEAIAQAIREAWSSEGLDGDEWSNPDVLGDFLAERLSVRAPEDGAP